MYPDLENCIIAIIGLGYVGLPLAVEFSIKQKSKKHSYLLDRKVIGYDINKKRIQQLEQGLDLTGEVSKEKINSDKIFMGSEYYLLNIWASWCAPCRSEHSLLMDLKEKTINEEKIINKAKKYLKKYSVKDTVDLIMETEQINKKKIYQICLKIKNEINY